MIAPGWDLCLLLKTIQTSRFGSQLIMKTKIVQVVYNFLNNSSIIEDNWEGWIEMWKLKVAQRLRCFFENYCMGGSQPLHICIISTWGFLSLVYFVDYFCKLVINYCGDVQMFLFVGT